MQFNDGLDEGFRLCGECGVPYDVHSREQACYCAVVCPCCGDARVPVSGVCDEAFTACSTACLLDESLVRRELAAYRCDRCGKGRADWQTAKSKLCPRWHEGACNGILRRGPVEAQAGVSL